MKRSIFLLIAFSLVVVAAKGQVVPSATAHTLSVSVGGLGSMGQPDWAGEPIAQTSPNRLYGVGVYFDAHFSRWIQIEGEGKWMRFNQYQICPQCPGNGEDTYLIGPRIPIVDFHGLKPYGKFLVGLGNGPFLTANTFVFAYGGGLDYRLSRRFTLRAIDFEYQQWEVAPTLNPYGGSVGISYKIF
ncbi:MAG TPA: outer membrane beta-barrel protein [Terracidiphilus sp.]|nr:outer membrane beta-barrel protein [Terracidiphilus sp.]